MLRDAIDFACVEVRARIRPSQRAIRMTKIEQELRFCRGQLIVLSSQVGLLRMADEQQLTFDEITRRIGEAS
ncbi:hypothetical protein [Actinophytocola sp.]|uniref:hypothetical protein n=1 Tax=Actinophytocola sp. TaxID=1872138 RepID=UPI002D7EE6FF|nr:hypothetical protein [Actinophytocola sp.]HET9143869.1 hypothetical protein [Actinophytocola sp.]